MGRMKIRLTDDHRRSHVRLESGRYVSKDEWVVVNTADVVVNALRGAGLIEEKQVDETCDVVKSDGERCGRDLPCPYHS